jgi:hypothetical protein
MIGAEAVATVRTHETRNMLGESVMDSKDNNRISILRARAREVLEKISVCTSDCYSEKAGGRMA